MKLSLEILSQLQQIAIQAATKAGLYIDTHKPITVEHKSVGSSVASQVVTEVDRASQKLIIEALQASIQQYDLGLLAEEEDDDGSRLVKDYFWCIDPLDGTLPFIEGRSGYAVAIALINKNGVPEIGVVYNPREEKCYSAIRGGGVFLNGETFIPQEKEKETFTIFHHRSLLKYPNCNEILQEYQNSFEEKGHRKFKSIHHGGAVMNAIWVIENQPSFYFALPKKAQGGGCIWDYAATACLFFELGYQVTDYYGKLLMLNDPETIFMNRVGVKFSNY